jgi:glutamate-5-semialdehyde dehydrogenase
MMNLEKHILNIVQSAKKASIALSLISTEEKNKALYLMAKALMAKQAFLIIENQKDVRLAKQKNYPSALVDRLVLNEKRIKAMTDCLLGTARLKDPIGNVIKSFKRPNGLLIKKVRVPIGVVGIIYESRPNVTSDCIGLCLKSGNAAILKGGKEAFYSNMAIFKVLQGALGKTKIPKQAIQFIDSTEHKAVDILLRQDKDIDVIVPRGGESLIRFVAEHSLIPVVKHYKGVCHTYVSSHANLEMACKICLNAKVQRPGVCNAMETMLVHQNVAKRFLPLIVRDMMKAGVEIRGCRKTRAICGSKIKKAVEKDWFEEYLDLILAVKVVQNTQEAIDHINTYGTRHSDAIITGDKREAQQFLKAVDSACVYVNASTRFTDGYEFGMGAEIGISTDKLHVRGPMGLEDLTIYKYLVVGHGQIRS